MATTTGKPSLSERLVRAAADPSLVADKAGSYVARWRKARIDLARERQASLAFLSAHFGQDAAPVLAEYRQSSFKTWFAARRRQLATSVGDHMNSSDFDLETLYLLVRLARPQAVVETGVLYGGSSAHILEAMRRNGMGRLYSIDLPRDDNTLGHGFLVPPALRYRWQLTSGDSKVELPKLLKGLGQIDLFHHDSLHTYEHMIWEYSTAYLYLGATGILSSHDVVTGLFRNPFADFCRRHWLSSVVFRNIGLAVQARGEAGQPRTA